MLYSRKMKKGIEWSLVNLGGLIIAAIVLVGLLGGFQKAYSIIRPGPNAQMEQNFERLVATINSVQEGEHPLIPVQIDSGYKITSGGACLKNCLCLCAEDNSLDVTGQVKDGCTTRLYKQSCFDTSEVRIESKKLNDLSGEGISYLELVSKSPTLRIVDKGISCREIKDAGICLARFGCYLQEYEQQPAGGIPVDSCQICDPVKSCEDYSPLFSEGLSKETIGLLKQQCELDRCSVSAKPCKWDSEALKCVSG